MSKRVTNNVHALLGHHAPRRSTQQQDTLHGLATLATSQAGRDSGASPPPASSRDRDSSCDYSTRGSVAGSLLSRTAAGPCAGPGSGFARGAATASLRRFSGINLDPPRPRNNLAQPSSPRHGTLLAYFGSAASQLLSQLSPQVDQLQSDMPSQDASASNQRDESLARATTLPEKLTAAVAESLRKFLHSQNATDFRQEISAYVLSYESLRENHSPQQLADLASALHDAKKAVPAAASDIR